ncbi:unnamed protein product [Arabis nemorensis]|uniref:Uncharacterized protein n=1 Tax=Arabis nemorensis TaxID=586526 RepID=A0A565CQ41_9BRAS|nr:unnamed protein product [Arabis nemorensis]
MDSSKGKGSSVCTQKIKMVITNSHNEKLRKNPSGSFRFDFSGYGESEGSFNYGNYNYEADDLHSVIQHLSSNNTNTNRVITTILGHSRGIRLGEGYPEKLKEHGFIDATEGKSEFRVTEESLMERLNTDMRQACTKIDKECKVLTR